MKDHFSVNELAKHFGVNPKTIYRRLGPRGFRPLKVVSALVPALLVLFFAGLVFAGPIDPIHGPDSPSGPLDPAAPEAPAVREKKEVDKPAKKDLQKGDEAKERDKEVEAPTTPSTK